MLIANSTSEPPSMREAAAKLLEAVLPVYVATMLELGLKAQVSRHTQVNI